MSQKYTRAVFMSVFVILLTVRLLSADSGDVNDNGRIEELSEQLVEMRDHIRTINERHQNEIEGLRDEIDALRREKGDASYQAALRKEIDQLLGSDRDTVVTVSPTHSDVVSRAFQNFNPDISVIGDFLYHAVEREDGEFSQANHEGHDHSGSNNEDRFQFRELEVAFSAAVDPFARADVFVHVHEHDGEWHAGLCEGYLTFLTLPLDLQGRCGKFRSVFGKANRLHTHNMPWVDRPDVIANFFGDEGMSEEGVEVSWLVSNPWDHYIELTFDLQNNENDRSFAGSDADDVMYLAHLTDFFDLSQTSSLELGGSFATAPNDHGHGSQRTCLVGLDATFKWRPLRQGLYKSITWQNELLFSRKEQGYNEHDGEEDHHNLNTVNSWGMYNSLEYQLARRWSLFGRYDYSELPDDDDSYTHAYSTGVTFNQSEYCFWRLAGKRTTGGYAHDDDPDRYELWLQLNFGIGPHRAHKY